MQQTKRSSQQPASPTVCAPSRCTRSSTVATDYCESEGALAVILKEKFELVCFYNSTQSSMFPSSFVVVSGPLAWSGLIPLSRRFGVCWIYRDNRHNSEEN